ncbi:hypothetical protein JX266_011815 [Neoarthrinium moseri]|nr:hypothetical protein JX266_011815 [Neoarthrinium moseri]
MGSSQPYNGAGPFGYSINRDDLFFEAPEPAPGPPLLSLEENNNLNNILEQLASSPFNGVSFGEGLNFSDAWQQLPPQFMGTATAYGHHPAQPFSPSVFDFSDSNIFDAFQFQPSHVPTPHLMQPPRHHQRAPMRSSHGQSSGADAAAVLTALQSGQAARSNGIGRSAVLPSQPGRPTGHPIPQPQNHYIGRSSPMRPAAIQSPVAPMTEHRDENLFADMAFGNPHGQSSHRVAQQVPEDVRWGTDRSFAGPQSFIPSSQRETSDVLVNDRIKYLDCFQLSNSTTNTRPPSPLGNGNDSPVGGRNGKLNGHSVLPHDVDGPPKKRRKSQVKEEADDEEDAGPSSSKAAARKRKSKDNLNASSEASSSASAPGKRRRKSNVNGPKPPRENLSDEAKRRNHIKSEQRRRTIIKTGFDDLAEIVPNLKNGGYSKSTMLQMGAEYLVELMKGNETLRL